VVNLPSEVASHDGRHLVNNSRVTHLNVSYTAPVIDVLLLLNFLCVLWLHECLGSNKVLGHLFECQYSVSVCVHALGYHVDGH